MKQKEIKSHWHKLYRQYQSGGQTIRAFCQGAGVNYWTFREWIKRFEKESSPGFIELKPAGPAGSYAVVLKNGRKVELPEHFSAEWARRLIELCEKC